MTWILLFVFLLAVIPSEVYICRKDASLIRYRRRRLAYKWVTLGFWILTVAMFAWAKISRDPANEFIRVLEVVMVLFVMNGVSKTIFAVATWIGRKAGGLSASYAIAAVIIIVLNIAMTYGATTGRWNIRKERADIVSNKIPRSFNGFRVVVFSDLHLGNLLDASRVLTAMVDAVNSLDADVVINCGDLVNNKYTDLDDEAMEILSGIESRYGVYSVLGNHDLGKYLPDTTIISRQENTRLLMSRINRMGWKVLRNETVTISGGSDTIYLSGVELPQELMEGSSHKKIRHDQGYEEMFAGVEKDKFNITVSHVPQTWRQLLATGKSDLTISGHIHSMQLKLRIGHSRAWSPARLFYKEWSGLYSENGNYLYINDGIGHGIIPMRIGCIPEVTVIELRNNEDNSVCGGNE